MVELDAELPSASDQAVAADTSVLAAVQGPDRRRVQLKLLAGEELERGLVEPFGVFVQAGVGEVLEDH